MRWISIICDCIINNEVSASERRYKNCEIYYIATMTKNIEEAISVATQGAAVRTYLSSFVYAC